ncbi:hypothetical protein [Parasitella parasitica]|uniref:Uncharacterized protein n=1 Tax=Parasitella parasitica TaxID=35722 RepID=A0A0B7NX47_9FUNG|nr:hypothetical protein [Parasitella parasitica]
MQNLIFSSLSQIIICYTASGQDELKSKLSVQDQDFAVSCFHQFKTLLSHAIFKSKLCLMLPQHQIMVCLLYDISTQEQLTEVMMPHQDEA